jgi:hypothetical protein
MAAETATATMKGIRGKGHRKFALAQLQKLHPFCMPPQRETKSRAERWWGNAINRRFPHGRADS